MAMLSCRCATCVYVGNEILFNYYGIPETKFFQSLAGNSQGNQSFA